MSETSKIEWTDATWNPVTGCVKVSPGCKFCYAETFAERFRGVSGHPYEQGFDVRLWPDRIDAPRHWARPRMIFVNSMSDLFQEAVPDAFIDSVFAVMIEMRRHTFQVLTKRPERMASYLAARPALATLAETAPNIWLGASIESHEFISRTEIVADLPSAVRFLSCEPLLGPVKLKAVLGPCRVNWVIVGGESGRGARPMESQWVHDLRDECIEGGVPFFFKQWGGTNKKATGRRLDGRTWDQFPSARAATVGADPSPERSNDTGRRDALRSVS